MTELDLKYPDESGNQPKLDKCFLCGCWQPDQSLRPISVPDGAGAWIEKKACRSCLDKILDPNENEKSLNE